MIQQLTRAPSRRLPFGQLRRSAPAWPRPTVAGRHRPPAPTRKPTAAGHSSLNVNGIRVSPCRAACPAGRAARRRARAGRGYTGRRSRRPAATMTLPLGILGQLSRRRGRAVRRRGRRAAGRSASSREPCGLGERDARTRRDELPLAARAARDVVLGLAGVLGAHRPSGRSPRPRCRPGSSAVRKDEDWRRHWLEAAVDRASCPPGCASSSGAASSATTCPARSSARARIR